MLLLFGLVLALDCLHDANNISWKQKRRKNTMNFLRSSAITPIGTYEKFTSTRGFNHSEWHYTFDT